MLGKQIELLLVEDNQGDIELTKEALEESKLNNNLQVVTDGQQALDYLFKRGEFSKRPTPNLILLDLNLPRKSGREVLAEIKSDKNLQKIPVVILTSSKAEEDIIKTYELHANAYIKKPLDFTSFLEIIQAIDSFWFSIVELPKL